MKAMVCQIAANLRAAPVTVSVFTDLSGKIRGCVKPPTRDFSQEAMRAVNEALTPIVKRFLSGLLSRIRMSEMEKRNIWLLSGLSDCRFTGALANSRKVVLHDACCCSNAVCCVSGLYGPAGMPLKILPNDCKLLCWKDRARRGIGCWCPEWALHVHVVFFH